MKNSWISYNKEEYVRLQRTIQGRYIFASSLESANSSILASRNLFKDFEGKKIRIL